MIKKRIQAVALAVAVAIAGLTLGAVKPAEAKSNGREKLWRIGTYLGAAGTGVALVKNKDTLALIGAGVTALSYTQWKKEVRNRHKRERSYRNVSRYRYGRRSR